MNTRRLSIVAHYVFVLAVLGCGSSMDVTNDPSYGNFGVVVGSWKTKTPLWLVRIGGTVYLNVANTTYEQSDSVIETVPTGSELRIEHLTLTRTAEVDLLSASGSLVTGPHAGEEIHLDVHLFARAVTGCYVVA